MTLRSDIEKVLWKHYGKDSYATFQKNSCDELMPLIQAEIAAARADECDGSCPHLMSCPRFKIEPPKQCNGCFDIYCDCNTHKSPTHAEDLHAVESKPAVPFTPTDKPIVTEKCCKRFHRADWLTGDKIKGCGDWECDCHLPPKEV